MISVQLSIHLSVSTLSITVIESVKIVQFDIFGENKKKKLERQKETNRNWNDDRFCNRNFKQPQNMTDLPNSFVVLCSVN